MRKNKIVQSGNFPAFQRGLFGPGIFVLSGSEIYKTLVNTFINTKKTRVSKYVELEKDLEPQAEVGEGPCLTSPNSSRCLFSPLSGTALHYLVGVNSCFPLTWHWVHHLYLTSQGSGSRACSFVTSCTVQQCTLSYSTATPSQRLMPLGDSWCW